MIVRELLDYLFDLQSKGHGNDDVVLDRRGLQYVLTRDPEYVKVATPPAGHVSASGVIFLRVRVDA